MKKSREKTLKLKEVVAVVLAADLASWLVKPESWGPEQELAQLEESEDWELSAEQSVERVWVLGLSLVEVAPYLVALDLMGYTPMSQLVHRQRLRQHFAPYLVADLKC